MGRATVTPLELFFELVYVFAVTQFSHRLLGHPSSLIGDYATSET